MAACVFLAVFPSIAGLFIGLFFLEIGKLLFILGAQAHVSNLGEGRDLNHDFGWYGTAAALGQMAGPALAGFSIDTSGHRATWVIIALFMGGTVYFFPRLLFAGTMRRTENPEPGKPRKRKGIRYFLSTYALIAILASFAVIFADGARMTFYPVLLSQFGYSASLIGLYMSLRALVSVSVRFFMAWIVRTSGGRFPALILSLVILSLGIGSTPFCTGHLFLVFNAVLVGIGLGLALPLSMATVSEGVRPEDRGVAMGIRLTGNRLAQLINPVFFGLIAQTYGLGVSFVSGGFLLFGSVLPIIFWWRGEKRRSGI
jgi:MFS family permease